LERSLYVWSTRNRKNYACKGCCLLRIDYILQCFSRRFSLKMERRVWKTCKNTIWSRQILRSKHNIFWWDWFFSFTKRRQLWTRGKS
jgi:hypothetical protein